MIFGFSGTEKGMTPRQRKIVHQLLRSCRVTMLHLGDCIGADAEAYEEACALSIKTVGHPPTNDRKRAFLTYDEERLPKQYLDRNDDIAHEGYDGLIAAPPGWVEEQRDGTWSTIRRARKANRRIWIVRPDGTVAKENQ